MGCSKMNSIPKRLEFSSQKRIGGYNINFATAPIYLSHGAFLYSKGVILYWRLKCD